MFGGTKIFFERLGNMGDPESWTEEFKCDGSNKGFWKLLS